MRFSVLGFSAYLLLSSFQICHAQDQLLLEPIPRFAIPKSPIAIVRDTEPGKPFSVAGEHGALFGQQSGETEAWVFPLKVLSGLALTAEMADYPVPIEVNSLPGSIEVNPDHTTITYSHAAFTVKQHMFSPRAGQGSAPLILFEFASVRPLRLTFRFTPVVQRMWPAANFGRPNAEWVTKGDSGYYVLHTDNDEVTAAVAIPGAKSGILQPYQERPKIYPLEFKLAFDPAKDSNLYFPLLLATGANNAGLGNQLVALDKNVAQQFSSTKDYYTQLEQNSLSVQSPDEKFNQALTWAIVSIDQMKVTHGAEVGLVGGYYSSGDSARPGFGWYFGRDTLWTLYAVNAYGGFDLSRNALDFLFNRQRADGKMMHEYSQTADLVNWKDLPYLYASADATPLALMTMDDYVSASGDIAFLKKHWEALKRAYTFIRTHDSDGDGIYENTEGTGWVESWPPTMPHQEIYLAALDQQATGSMSRLATLMNESALASSAAEHASKIRSTLAGEYYDSSKHFYAFSRNKDGSTDKTATIYPSVAWWTGRFSLPDAQPMFTRWAAREFSTDWGTRDVSALESIFDPISYHQGSVWPLFTGWVSLAEFRAGRTLSGTAHLMQNLNLTYAQDLGAVTELLSGMFYQPLGRSSSHQLWSSAMVLNPALRGLLGLDFNAPGKTLRLTPHLPASWDHVLVHNVPLGDLRLELDMVRSGSNLVVRATTAAPAEFCLTAQSFEDSGECTHAARTKDQINIPLPGVEVELPYDLPAPGSLTGQIKVVDETLESKTLKLTFEGAAGTTETLKMRKNRRNVNVEGASLSGSILTVQFPAGAGLQRQTVSFDW